MTNTNEKAIEVERAAWKLLNVLENPGASPEDETRAALDLRRALGERPDPFAVLHAAEEAVIIAGGWQALHGEPGWWVKGDWRMPHDEAIAAARHEAKLAAKGGAS